MSPSAPAARVCCRPGCGSYACYGIGESLLRGIDGQWFCAAHVPASFWAETSRRVSSTPLGDGPPAPARQAVLL